MIAARIADDQERREPASAMATAADSGKDCGGMALWRVHRVLRTWRVNRRVQSARPRAILILLYRPCMVLAKGQLCGSVIAVDNGTGCSKVTA